MKLLHFSLLLSLMLIIRAEKNFNGHRLIRAYPITKKHINLLNDLELNDSGFDVWSSTRSSPSTTDILLSPMSFIKYKALFHAENLSFEILQNNIQNVIENQAREIQQSKSRDSSIIFKYARYSEIMKFVDETVASNEDIASSYIAGKTDEGRDIKVIVLNPIKTSIRSLWIDCGIHAREWVSPATCVYTIDTLIKEFKANDPETVAIFNKYQIHIMPIVNPDGYEYSHTSVRLWRKNRKSNYGSSCLGVDLNRNWGYKWMTGGSSRNPCSDIYAGPNQDSEPEVKAIQESLRNKVGNWDAYFNVHSYGNWWLLPWGYTYSFIDKPSNLDEMMEKAKIAMNAIQAVNGEVFEAGASSDLLYVNSGSSKDWTYGELNIKQSVVIELRPGRNSPDYRYGFMLPESRMPLVAKETYAGIKAFYSSLL